MTRRGALLAALVGSVLAVLLALLTAPPEASVLPTPARTAPAPSPTPGVRTRQSGPGTTAEAPEPAASNGRNPLVRATTGGEGVERTGDRSVPAVAQGRAPASVRRDARPLVGPDGEPASSADRDGPTPDGFNGPRAQERAALLEDRVVNLLTTVAPELDGMAVSRTCSANGRTCTFEGPWPGDDFAVRWVETLASGELHSDDMDGVTFQTFERQGGAEGDRFVITAEQPPGRILP